MLQPLRRPPLAQSIGEHLLANFKNADWLPPERRLANELGVSRSALREAIKQLENQGLLECRHGVGVRVTRNFSAPLRKVLQHAVSTPSERIRQFAAVRILVEPEIARLAAQQATPKEIALLQDCQRRMQHAANFPDAVTADLEFHRHLATIAGNQVLALMLASIAELEEQARLVTLRRVGLSDAHSQHQQVLDAVVSGDSDAARDAMLRHVQAAQNTPPRRTSTSRRTQS